DGEEDHQQLHQVVARQEAEHLLIQLRGRERKECGEGHAGGRRRQADEVALRATGLSDVEPGEPDGRRHHVEVAEDPLRLAAGREFELVDEKCRRDAEAHHIHQAVELRAEPRAGAREPRHPAVQRVEDAGEEDVPAGAIELAARRQHHGPDAEEQIEQREQARHDDHDAPHVGAGERLHGAYSTNTVAPACTRSPTATRTVDGAAMGKNTSTREPNRMMPIRAPCVARSPATPSVTMRRAMSPAIWRTSKGPRAPRSPTDACSLSRLALSDAAWRNRPGWCRTSSTMPVAG